MFGQARFATWLHTIDGRRRDTEPVFMRFGDADAISAVGARDDFHPELKALGRIAPRGNAGSATALKAVRRLMALRKSRVTGIDVASLGNGVDVRIFRGGGRSSAQPALLWMHGGGYVAGRANLGDRLCRAFADALDITVASVEYRLAPEHPYPAALHDCHDALGYLLGLPWVDPERIAIGGQSSGAGLAAALAFRLRDTDTVTVVRQLLAYPMLDDRTSGRVHPNAHNFRFWNTKSNRFSWTAYLGDADPEIAAPGRRTDLGGLPPAWIGVGSLDLFCDEGAAYADDLRAAGVPCELVVVNGAFHGFDEVAPKAAVAQAFFAKQCLSLADAFRMS
ncbi:alpha/beta hydrolase [Mycolicibacterium porcinum]|uniref:Alpha/beta hydrolase n=1 Tax=Mycolicibacterium porcinum TaxID=39693 RepID=A0ABV3VI16_9MYCO